MNSIDRIQKTFGGDWPDRRATVIVSSLYGSKYAGCSLERFYRDSEFYARGQAEFHRTFGGDALISPFCFALIGEAFGGRLHFLKDQAPNLCRYGFADAGAFLQSELPDPQTHPNYIFFRESVARMRVLNGDEVPIVAVVPSPVDLPILIFGIEFWLELLLFEPRKARTVIERLLPHGVGLVRLLMEAGAFCVCTPCVTLNTKIATLDIAEMTYPYLRTYWRAVEAPVLLHHAGGPMLDYLERLPPLPTEVVGCVLDARDDVHRARNIVGPERVLLAGLDGGTLHLRDRESIERDCRNLLAAMRDDPRFILSTTGADISTETPEENLHAIRRMARCEVPDYAAV